jgi:hypothetical protein
MHKLRYTCVIEDKTMGQARKNNLESQLAAMASDPEIQKELYQIDEEFKVAEADESLS